MMDTYVLVTTARNEEAYIERTIQSVIAQTVLPRKWVIVSDGSTDRTDEIIQRYASRYGFIEYARLESDVERNFASMAYGQQAGVERLRDMEYGFLGMLDADISFEPDYYERVLAEFARNPKLGIAGGVLYDLQRERWVRQKVTVSLNVSGPVQLFRRQCYEDIGGVIPIEKGGVDAVAEVMARMHGWEVRSFRNIKVLHYRPTGTQGKSVYRVHFRRGSSEYVMGYHPLFVLAKCVRRVSDRPYVIASLLRLCGYCWSWWRREERGVGDEFVRYLRREQMQRIRPGALLTNARQMFAECPRNGSIL
jgi:biofilm PGA synthesis N-glycosyltransferase PgaC